jgi:hypothetical protein
MLIRFIGFVLLVELAACASPNSEFEDAWTWACYDENYHMGKESLTEETYGAGKGSISAAQMRLNSVRGG